MRRGRSGNDENVRNKLSLVTKLDACLPKLQIYNDLCKSLCTLREIFLTL